MPNRDIKNSGVILGLPGDQPTLPPTQTPSPTPPGGGGGAISDPSSENVNKACTSFAVSISDIAVDHDNMVSHGGSVATERAVLRVFCEVDLPKTIEFAIGKILSGHFLEHRVLGPRPPPPPLPPPSDTSLGEGDEPPEVLRLLPEALPSGPCVLPQVRVLDNFDWDFSAGQRVALLGSTGCGKSTLISLLMRYYDPCSGHVCVDGHDLAGLQLRSWRQHIGIVSQEPVLFDDSLAANIKYGKPDACNEEMYNAARKAKIHDYIMSLPEGYETHVGPRGSRLSGGQKQRCVPSLVRPLSDTPGPFPPSLPPSLSPSGWATDSGTVCRGL